MSTLVFDGDNHTVTLFDAQNNQVGQWHANNVVDSRATLRFVPNRNYQIIDQTHSHRHNNGQDTRNGAYGRFGIVRLQEFTVDGQTHDGVGVHSGRENQGGADHATMGCIRTTDEAMEAITQHMLDDPLTSITVQNNHEQHNRRPRQQGDHHPNRRRRHPAQPQGQPRNTPMT
jgi:hypothetical protein